jgi:hypothetical protein
MVASFSAFWTGQAIFASKGLDVSISEPGVLRAVFGGALYLAAVGLLGIGLGFILRRTAGAVAALVGLLVLAPLVGGFLPASFQESAGKFFPAQAGPGRVIYLANGRGLTGRARPLQHVDGVGDHGAVLDVERSEGVVGLGAPLGR